MNVVVRSLIAGLVRLIPVACFTQSNAAELRVNTDFEGSSARVQTIDQTARIIHLMPGGDPQRGWPCWWCVRIDGIAKDERIIVNLTGSDRPARNNGQDTGKPLASAWAMPLRATMSGDGEKWTHTAPGRREGNTIRYEVVGTGGPIWIAWGPLFTPGNTDALIAKAEKLLPDSHGFELAKTRGGRSVRALRISSSRNDASARKLPGIWVQARQHAWESGASWVARGLVEWLCSDDEDARWLRENAEIVVVPIMDVDNAATGNGGKEAAPRDHNRDWDEQPVYPEVDAVQKHLRKWAAEERLEAFVDLHNPGPSDARPFFFIGPEDLLSDVGRKNRTDFLDAAKRRIAAPLELEEKPRITGPGYHPLWRQISGQWVNANGNPWTVAACLETSWNTPHSTPEGYVIVGGQLGAAIADYVQGRLHR